MKLLGRYINGNYKVSIFEDGTKIRFTKDDDFYPQFPETMDINISNRCANGCKFCYQNCTPNGKHCDFLKYPRLLDSLRPYMEVAINGNNLTDIPQLRYFLGRMRDKHVIVNMTVNQVDFEKNIDFLKQLTDEKLIYGLGVSLNRPTDEFVTKIKQFPNAIIHIINGIFGPYDYIKLRNQGLKLLVLGYKKVGRGAESFIEKKERIVHLQAWLNYMLPRMNSEFDVISFDNLALEQLDVKSLVSDKEWEDFFMGEDGTFSFYINLVDGYFAKNSMSEEHYPIGDRTIDEMFGIILGDKA